MDGQVSKSKKTGVFRRGLQGVTGVFKGLFTRVGRFGGLLLGIRQTMNTDLDKFSETGKDVSKRFTGFDKPIRGVETQLGNTQRTMQADLDKSKKTGVFRKGLQGTGGKFKGLFRVLGKFGGLLGGVGLTMLSFLDPSSLGKVFTTVGDSFKSLFSVVTNFGKEIGKVASAAAGATADAVKSALKSVASIGAKPDITKTSIGTPKAQTTSPNLGGSGTGDASPKVSSAVDAPTVKTKPPNLYTLDTTSSKIPMMDLKSSKITPTSNKLSKQVTEEVLSRSIAKNAAKLALKSVIVVGAVTSGYFALSKLLKGDYVGAAMEGGDIFAPSLVGLPLSTATAIRDIYNESYGTDSNKFPFDKDLANNPTETNKRLGVIKDQLMKQLGMNKSKKNTAPEIKPQETSSDTIDFSKIRTFQDYKKVQGQLRVNPSYDIDGSGIYNKKEFRAAQGGAKLEGSGSPVYEGPMFLQPTRIVTNNQQSVVISRPITDTSFGGIMSSR